MTIGCGGSRSLAPDAAPELPPADAAFDTLPTADSSDAEAEGSDVRFDDATDGGDDGDAGVAEAVSAAPAAPIIKDVVTMKDGMHITWLPNAVLLDGVEIWRRRNATPYVQVKTLTGEFDNIHDYDVVAPAFYCYRLKNRRAGVSSELSDEMCGAY